jgi:putative hydrolase of the HAD superfamily
MPPALGSIDSWIFDLDNTLYPARVDLFALIDEKMGSYIQRLLDVDATEARRVQKHYFIEHGTTLSGLMAHEGVNPRDFLDFVHDIDMSRLAPDPLLNSALAKLPGRKLVYTNGDAAYAGRVLAGLGLAEAFDGLFDIHGANYRPKPHPDAYEDMCSALGVEPTRALFVEDMARNLKPAKAIGMATVWVNNGSEHGSADASPEFIDFETHDLSHWLNEIMETVR